MLGANKNLTLIQNYEGASRKAITIQLTIHLNTTIINLLLHYQLSFSLIVYILSARFNWSIVCNMYVCIHVCSVICICMCRVLHVSMYICMWVLCIYVFMYVSMYVCTMYLEGHILSQKIKSNPLNRQDIIIDVQSTAFYDLYCLTIP